MKNAELPQRRSVRLKDYDYSQPGFYFVTICTAGMKCKLSEVIFGEVKPSAIGEIVSQYWLDIPSHFPNVELGRYVVMPNHLHGLFAIHPRKWMPHIKQAAGDARAQHAVPLSIPNEVRAAVCSPADLQIAAGPLKRTAIGSVASIVRSFKAAASNRVRQLLRNPKFQLWQRNYYESVVRSPREIRTAERYIIENPARWRMDKERGWSED